MNIHITYNARPNKPFILSCENKEALPEGQTEFVSAHTSALVSRQDCVCTQSVYNAIAGKVGTMEAPALIASAGAEKHPDRVNVYIENGSLKIAA